MPSGFDILFPENMKLATSELRFLLIHLKMHRGFNICEFESVISPRYAAHLGDLSYASFCNQIIALGIGGCLNDAFMQAGGVVWYHLVIHHPVLLIWTLLKGMRSSYLSAYPVCIKGVKLYWKNLIVILCCSQGKQMKTVFWWIMNVKIGAKKSWLPVVQ